MLKFGAAREADSSADVAPPGDSAESGSAGPATSAEMANAPSTTPITMALNRPIRRGIGPTALRAESSGESVFIPQDATEPDIYTAEGSMPTPRLPMGLFSKRTALPDGVDPARLPPGQYLTDRFPVLHAGVVPSVDLDLWDFTVMGLVEEEATWSLADIKAMPTSEVVRDIHCVTKWSKLDTRWGGVRVVDFMKAGAAPAGGQPRARPGRARFRRQSPAGRFPAWTTTSWRGNSAART